MRADPPSPELRRNWRQGGAAGRADLLVRLVCRNDGQACPPYHSVVTLFTVGALIAAVQTATWKELKQRMKTLVELFDQTRMFRKFI